MDNFSVEVEIAQAPEVVMAALWRLDHWPEIAPHVVGIEIVFEDENVQVLFMTVRSRGESERFKSVRIRQPGSLLFQQPSPPPFLRRHSGSWEVRDNGKGGAVVVSRHEVEIDIDRAAAYLSRTQAGVSGKAEVRTALIGLITHNSKQTLLGLKRRLEEGVTHAAA
jgi:hypothetical protein